jgi:hypothetical protein
LQDENGTALSGVNTDEEPIPSFVHNVAPNLLLPTGEDSKNVARCHSDVTMRLETPVLYFYPDKDFNSVFDVRVSMSHGWLTQFFPNASATAPGLEQDGTGTLRFAMSELRWKNISLSFSEEGPATRSLVWTTPRQVNAATVEVGGEHEKFLFYRGVARIDAPVRVVRSGPELRMTRNDSGKPDEIHQLWLADIRPNGTAAFRVVRPFTEETAFLVRTPAAFNGQDYSPDAVSELKSSLRAGLVNAGLFEEEADALLNTWQVSYFHSPGLRLFFLVPERWTNRSLPIHISFPKISSGADRTKAAQTAPEIKLTRVMVGRIELVTPEQREILARIAAGHSTAMLSGASPEKEMPSDEEWNQLHLTYMQLGRFGNALLLDEQRRSPGPALAQFIKRFRLAGYTAPRWPRWPRRSR